MSIASRQRLMILGYFESRTIPAAVAELVVYISSRERSGVKYGSVAQLRSHSSRRQ
jgi:hypothetical protein